MGDKMKTKSGLFKDAVSVAKCCYHFVRNSHLTNIIIGGASD